MIHHTGKHYHHHETPHFVRFPLCEIQGETVLIKKNQRAGEGRCWLVSINTVFSEIPLTIH